MMRSRNSVSVKEEEENPEPKRPKREGEDENTPVSGKERVKVAMQEKLTQLIEDRRADVQQAEEEFRKAEAQLGKARKRLGDAEAQLATLQGRSVSKESPSNASVAKVKLENDADNNSRSPMRPSSNGLSGSVVKGLTKKVPESRTSSSSAGRPEMTTTPNKIKSAKNESLSPMDKRPVKKRPEPKESANLVPSIRSGSTHDALRLHPGTFLSSQHKRKLRSLIINHTAETLLATSALDGVISLWQIHNKGVSLYPLSSIDCLSPKQRRWAEDMVWHPNGDSIFACYTADGNDNQVAMIDSSAKTKVKFLDDKPHIKGIVNSIAFLPWADVFVTGGSDHAACIWEEKETNDGLKWKAKALHRSQHSSAVMGVAGLRSKELVLSAGADKRVVAHDPRYNRADIRTLDSKVMGVLPNTADYNLFMVQTGTPGQQLRLYDIRSRAELHSFGWKQDLSDSQSALINQSWSPDGYKIASGSTDPKIHIFDIRYNSKDPAQSIRAHQKRVFTAAWHHSFPLLVSISSDLNIGLHRYLA